MFNKPRAGFRARGAYRGRGSRGNTLSSRPTPPEESQFPSRDLMEGLVDTAITQLEIPISTNETSISAEISEVEYIGSYNWLEESCTLVTPGSPGEWLNKPTPYTLEADKDERFKDQNGFRVPSSPLMPLVAVVDAHTEASQTRLFDWPSVDVVTDRNGLRKLLRWIRGNADKDFRIDLQLAGKKTVLLSRWEAQTKELPKFANTFGRNFEAYTTKEAPGCEGSTGHHRIVRYDFGGLKMVVRFEVDACIPSALSTGGTVDDIISGLSRANIADETQVVNAGDITLRMQKGGSVVSQSSIVEIASVSKNRWTRGQYDWEEAIVQLTVSQTPHLFLGIHERGTFSDIKKYSGEAPEWKQALSQVKPSLLKLRRVLDEIITLVIDQGEEARLSLLCKNGKLVVYRREDGADNLLPTDFLDEFL